MSGKPTLLYFPIPGRGEPCRISLWAAFGKDGWVNEHMAFEEFGAEKKKIAAGEASKLVTGALPQLTLADGVTSVTQSHAISRWACETGRKEGKDLSLQLYPDDPMKCLLINEMIAHVDDLLTKCPQDADPEVKKTKRLQYANEGYMKTACQLMEKRLSAVPGGPFLFGEDPSLADIYLGGVLVDMILSGNFDYIDPSYLDQFPKLKTVGAALKETNLMKSYNEAYPK